ncbi:MAG: anthranilate phosphoribosyltransferase [Opitutaceae bacterium]
MSALLSLQTQLEAGTDLSSAQVGDAVAALISAEVTAERKELFLSALATKGEKPAEVAAFAAEFRKLARDPGVAQWAPEAIDIVGTGGDHAGSFNISTATAFVLAAAGVKVMKHGNRSITSKCGSADLIAAIGVPLEAPLDRMQRSLAELNFCFFFAPAFHPAFKEIAPVRKALAAKGRRSVFNILGPLINPGRPAFQLFGVYAKDWVEPLANALHDLGLTAALAIHGRVPGTDRGLDEWSTATENFCAGAGRLRGPLTPVDLAATGLEPGRLEELQGGDAAANLAIFEALLENRAPRTIADTVALNAGAALWVTGRARDLAAGVAQVQELLRSGAVKRHVARTRQFWAG